MYIISLRCEPRPVDIPFFHIPLLCNCSMHVYIQLVKVLYSEVAEMMGVKLGGGVTVVGLYNVFME